MSEEQIYKIVDNAFDKFDQDKNGKLDYDEMAKLLTQIFKEANNPKTPDQLKQIIKEGDKNGDGNISRK